MIKVSCLVENQSQKADLASEHGLSILIEISGKKILFDTGASGLFLENAKKMGIKLEEVDLVVVSHGHHDHGGGLGSFFQINHKAPVFMAKGADKKHFKISDSSRTDISLDEDILGTYTDRIHFLNSPLELRPGLYIITGIEQTHPAPNGNKLLFEKNGDKFLEDKFHHELIMVLKDKGGLLVFTGCSHNGILNMLDTVTYKFPDAFIKAVFGGFHLMLPPDPDSMAMSRTEVGKIGEKLLQMSLGMVFTGHCTGNKAYGVLKEVMGDKLQYFSTGDVLRL